MLSSGLTSQLPLPLHALIQCQRLQLILHLRAHAHQLVTMQEQLPVISLGRRGHPDPRKTILRQKLQQ